MKRSQFKRKPCAECQSLYHSKGYHKPRTALRTARKPMKRESDKTKSKRQATALQWDKLNPPDENGEWTCYLQISPDCPIKLTKQTLVREHYYSKTRRPDLKYEVSNIRPACDPCNSVKLSRNGDEFNK